jgi:hypothetical protein
LKGLCSWTAANTGGLSHAGESCLMNIIGGADKAIEILQSSRKVEVAMRVL